MKLHGASEGVQHRTLSCRPPDDHHRKRFKVTDGAISGLAALSESVFVIYRECAAFEEVGRRPR